MKTFKKVKRKAFKIAKKILPDPIVMDIQKTRLEENGLGKHKRGSYSPFSNYTVVSAVYNVEKYLDTYFQSLIDQTIDPNNLHIIAVDDGSTDHSSEIICRWQKKFPNQITYLHKPNGGQASARNFGLLHVKSDWVTFIDPDDFVSNDYFEEVDKEIRLNSDLRFISCNWIFFYEKEARFADRHPLRYRFQHAKSYFSVSDDYKYIQFAMNSVFFSMEELSKQGIFIDESIRPNFEDGHFVNKYLLNLENGVICFLKKPKYYYRKRAAGTSTLDSSWDTPDRVMIVPKNGYLDLLRYAKSKKGYVPFFIQATILYDLSWYFKRFIGHPEKSRAIEKANLAHDFLETLKEIFLYIDKDTIMSCQGSWYNFDYKNALLKSFRHEQTNWNVIYLERVDPIRNAMLITTSDNSLMFYDNGFEIAPFETKQQTHLFFGSELFNTYYCWFKITDAKHLFSFQRKDGASVNLAVRGKQYPHSTSFGEIISRFTSKWESYPNHGYWIIMDRDNQADDNGEHLYRFILKHHPEQKCYFAIRKSSPDWTRLETEGFSLLDFGSKKYEEMVRCASAIISSHAEKYIYSYFGDNFHYSKHFVFLQHGVTKDDISPWINNKPISLFITATHDEYHSIVDDGSQYGYTPSQVKLTGFPRHDALPIGTTNQARPCILIMPTWRASLVGGTKGKGNIRDLNPDFSQSEYKTAWESLINHKKLRDIAIRANAKIVFFPHANIAPYLEGGYFKVPSYVSIASNGLGKSIQKHFIEASVMITDYSSTAFEMAYMKKPCLYYQFDKETFFSGTQVYAEGYFDYEKDGFGPVCYDEDSLLNALEQLAYMNFSLEEPYTSRVESTFPFRDGLCCERVYSAIQNLFSPTKS